MEPQLRELINFTDCTSSSLLNPWDAKTNSISHCFTLIGLEIPIYSLFCITSSYYIGKRSINYSLYTKWNNCQKVLIYSRAFISTLLSFLPLIYLLFQLISINSPIGFTTLCTSAIKTFAWVLHLIYILRLKRGISYNTKGPKSIQLAWLLTGILSAISFRTAYLNYLESSESNYVELLNCASECLCQFLYFCSLIPTSVHLDEFQYRSLNTDSPAEASQENPYVGFHEDDGNELGVAKESSSLLSKLFFNWVNKLMKKGSCGYLAHHDDLFDLPHSISTSFIGSNFRKYSIQSQWTFIKALHREFGAQFYLLGLLKIVSDGCGFGGPILLNLLVGFIEGGSENVEFYMGYLYVAGMFASSLVGSLADVHFNMGMTEVSLKIRAAIVTTIYRKTLLLKKTSLENLSSGEILNYMSTDTDRITNFCPSFHAFWSLPLQIGISLYLLYTQIGLAFLAGLLFAIVLIPINKIIANKIGVLSTNMMEHKDNRVKVMSEILYGIRNIKLHSWEEFFINRVNEIRKKELQALKGRKYLDALCVYFWATTPVLVSVLSFGTYILLGNELTASKVFTSLSLFNMLIGPLNALPWVINGVVESWVSVKRLSNLLQAEESDPSQLLSSKIPNASDIVVLNGDFEWTSSQNDSSSAFRLSSINLEINKGDFIGIVGEVGSGKSSLLLSLLGELNISSGELYAKYATQGYGVVLQEPWIQRGSIRRNILFGKAYDADKYSEVIKACCLTQDFEELENGDDTICSSNTLSGGQKLRITLARAVYQDKPIYLLDDIFSSVDLKVASELYKYCVMGALKNKTRILCTHHIKFLRNADLMLVMDKGKIINQGVPSEMIRIFFPEEELGQDDSCASSPSGVTNRSSPLSSLSQLSNEQIGSIAESTEFINRPEISLHDELGEEQRKEGTISSDVIKSYWRAVGKNLSFFILLFLLLMQMSKNGSDLWLAKWVSSSNNTHPADIVTPSPIPPLFETYAQTHSKNETLSNLDNISSNLGSYRAIGKENIEYWSIIGEIVKKVPVLSQLDPIVKYYFTIFIAIGLLNSVFTFGRSFLFAFGSIRGGTNIHIKLLRVIMKAKMVFFDETPIGRIINRFSSDVSTVDDSLPFILNILLAQMFGLLGTLIVTSYALPWLLIVIIPLLLVVNNIQEYYRLTARQLRRLSSISLSPIYAHFSETLKGLVSIRGMRASKRFEQENEVYVESNQKARYATQCVSQWLSFRLQLIGVVLISSVGLIGVLQHRLGVADAGIIGLAISYALTITGSLSGFVTFFTETEKEMISVERVYEYINDVKTEIFSARNSAVLPYLWPLQGVITFRDVSLRYREGSSYALRHISFETAPCEKIGVVGRTGAGKSSLFQALFRITDSYRGEILIDNVNIKHLSLKNLRSKIWVIPQDPLVFSGSLRENIDPQNEYSDELIVRSLHKCHLISVLDQLGGLEAHIGENGNLLSAGQKQLVQLARALLVNPKILCIDEGTANVDAETDKIIQATIRNSFCASTVITVAHRVTSILHSNRVIVMKNGSIIEIDVPEKLLLDKSSYFYSISQGHF